MSAISKTWRRTAAATLTVVILGGSSISASAQDNVVSYVDFFWQDRTQDACLADAEAAGNQAIATFGLDVEARTSDWNFLANNPDYHFWIFCAADAGGIGVVDEAGQVGRILIITVVASGRPDINENLRDFLVDCMEFGCPVAIAGPETINWETNAISYRDRGALVDLICPPLGDESFRLIWGTDIYTDDSSICTAAVHAGAITPNGGAVTIEMLPGQASYTGSNRNGVNSANWGNYPSSFRFTRGSKG